MTGSQTTTVGLTGAEALDSVIARADGAVELLAGSPSDVLIIRDEAMVARWVSPSITEFLGWSPADLVGTDPIRLTHPDDVGRLRELRSSVQEGADTPGVVVRKQARDGSWRWTSITSHPLYDMQGRAIGAALHLRAVDDLVASQREAERAGQRLRAVLDVLLDPTATFSAVRDPDGALVDLRLQFANEAALAYWGLPLADLVGRGLLEFSPTPPERSVLARYFRTVDTGEPTFLDDFSFQSDGGGRRSDVRAVRLGDGLALTWRDVTDRSMMLNRVSASERHYRLLAENSSDVVAHVVDDRYVWVSPSLTRILGWSVSDWIGQPTTRFTDRADDDAASEARAGLQRGETASIRRRVQDAAGAWHWVDATAHTYRDEEGRANGYTVSLRIVDREMEIAAELQRRARYDDLTGVLKREEAIARLTALGSQRRRPGGLPAVLFLDVDEFKQVNDTYGHLAGDALLTELAVRIRQCVRHNDVIARMGGDEFLVILEGIHDVQDVARIAENIRASAARPIVTGGHTVHATASIGITLSELGEDADAVIARADDAMYRAKRHGRNQVVALWD